MDTWDDILMRDGVVYPANARDYMEQLEHQAVHMLMTQLRDVTRRLREYDPATRDAIIRHRIASLQSVCAVALTHMTNFVYFDALAADVMVEMEAQEQPGEIQMPPPLGPEWDPPAEAVAVEEDPEEDPEMDEEEPEEDPDMDIEELEDPALVQGGFEGAPEDGEISEGEAFYDQSPIHWTPPSD